MQNPIENKNISNTGNISNVNNISNVPSFGSNNINDKGSSFQNNPQFPNQNTQNEQEEIPMNNDEENIYNYFENIVNVYNNVYPDENKRRDFLNKINAGPAGNGPTTRVVVICVSPFQAAPLKAQRTPGIDSLRARVAPCILRKSLRTGIRAGSYFIGRYSHFEGRDKSVNLVG